MISKFWLCNFEVSQEIKNEAGAVIIPENIGRAGFKLHQYLTNPKSCERFPLLHQLILSRNYKQILSPEKKIGARFSFELFATKTPEQSINASNISMRP